MRNGVTAVLLSILLTSLLLGGCFEKETSKNIAKMTITSSAFENNGVIPDKYTCIGDDVSPPLNFSDIPENAESLVLIMYDPDAPMGTFTHWMIWDIPTNVTGFSEGENIIYPQGKNDFGVTGYRGPCPPSGTHHYYFKIYALDTTLNLKTGATREQLEKALSNHILAEGQLIGVYSK